MPKKFEVDMHEILPPAQRLEQEESVRAAYDEACELLKSHQYKAAVRRFKWAFANDSTNILCIDSRLIRQLVKRYPPALVLVKRWRNDKEKLLKDQHANSDIVRSWENLNQALGERQRVFDVYEKLSKTALDEELRDALLDIVWTKLVRLRRYEELRPYLRSLGFHLLLKFTDLEIEEWFPRTTGARQAKGSGVSNYSFDYIINNGPLIYEVALAVDEVNLANEFAARILNVSCADEVCVKLIRSAKRARKYAEAQALYADMQKRVSPKRLPKTRAIVVSLPGAKVRR